MSKLFSGVIPFIRKNDKIFILLSKETWGKEKGCYSIFGGTSEPEEDKYECAIRECSEESGGYYQFTKNNLIEGTCVKYIEDNNLDYMNNESHIFFIETDRMLTTNILIERTNNIVSNIKKDEEKWPYQEKDICDWFDLKILMKLLESNDDTINIVNVNGVIKSITISNHIKQILLDHKNKETIYSNYIDNIKPYKIIFWGKFDPPTLAHSEIIKTALEQISPEKMLIILNDFQDKQYLFSKTQRVKMLETLLQNFNTDSDIKIAVQNENNIFSYSEMKKHNHSIIFALCGEDSFKLWLTSNAISEDDDIIVFERNGCIDNLPSNIIKMKLGNQFKNISSSAVKVLMSHNDNIKNMVPNTVYEYIKELLNYS